MSAKTKKKARRTSRIVAGSNIHLAVLKTEEYILCGLHLNKISENKNIRGFYHSLGGKDIEKEADLCLIKNINETKASVLAKLLGAHSNITNESAVKMKFYKSVKTRSKNVIGKTRSAIESMSKLYGDDFWDRPSKDFWHLRIKALLPSK